MVDHVLVPRVELDVDFTHGLASLLLEGMYVVAVRGGPPSRLWE